MRRVLLPTSAEAPRVASGRRTAQEPSVYGLAARALGALASPPPRTPTPQSRGRGAEKPLAQVQESCKVWQSSQASFSIGTKCFTVFVSPYRSWLPPSRLFETVGSERRLPTAAGL